MLEDQLSYIWLYFATDVKSELSGLRVPKQALLRLKKLIYFVIDFLKSKKKLIYWYACKNYIQWGYQHQRIQIKSKTKFEKQNFTMDRDEGHLRCQRKLTDTDLDIGKHIS